MKAFIRFAALVLVTLFAILGPSVGLYIVFALSCGAWHPFDWPTAARVVWSLLVVLTIFGRVNTMITAATKPPATKKKSRWVERMEAIRDRHQAARRN